MSDAVLAALLASMITGVVALASQYLSSRQASKRELAIQRAERIAAYVGASYASSRALSELASEPMDSKRQMELAVRNSAADRMNTIYSAIRILDASEVVEAATQLDLVMASLLRQARERAWSKAEWAEVRVAALGQHVENMVEVGRRYVDRS